MGNATVGEKLMEMVAKIGEKILERDFFRRPREDLCVVEANREAMIYRCYFSQTTTKNSDFPKLLI